jgi:hypothetical protein
LLCLTELLRRLSGRERAAAERPGAPEAHLAYRDPPPARIEAGPARPGVSQGWPRIVADLKTLLETGDLEPAR